MGQNRCINVQNPRLVRPPSIGERNKAFPISKGQESSARPLLYNSEHHDDSSGRGSQRGFGAKEFDDHSSFSPQTLSSGEKSLVPYRQCSAVRGWRRAGLLERSIVDTAICSKPLAFAADAVRLWGLNRLSPAIRRIIKS